MKKLWIWLIFILLLIVLFHPLQAQASVKRPSRGNLSFPTYRLVVMPESKDVAIVSASKNCRFVIGKSYKSMNARTVIWDTVKGQNYLTPNEVDPRAIGNDGTFVYRNPYYLKFGFGTLKNIYRRQSMQLEWQTNLLSSVFFTFRWGINSSGQMIGLYKENNTGTADVPLIIDKYGNSKAISGDIDGWIYPSDINDRGYVVCYNFLSSTKAAQTVLWRDGEFWIIPVGAWSNPYLLNNKNEIVGRTRHSEDEEWMPFFYSTKTGTQIMPGFRYVLGLNDLGYVVGSGYGDDSHNPLFAGVGAIWKSGMNGKKALDLNDLLVPSSFERWSVGSAYAINNSGVIIAQVNDKASKQHSAYIALLIPVN